MIFFVALTAWDFVWQVYQEDHHPKTTDQNAALFAGPMLVFVVQRWAHLWDFLERNEKPLLVLFTLGIVIYTYRLWSSTRDLVVDAQKANRQQARDMRRSLAIAARSAEAATKSADSAERGLAAFQRAYVSATFLWGEWRHDLANKGLFWHFRADLANSGNTPTKDLTVYTCCELRATPLPNGYDFIEVIPNHGSGMIGPHTTNRSGFAPPSSSPLSMQDLVDVYEGSKCLYFWGWAKYRDTFPGTPMHKTAFCWYVMPSDPRKFVPGAKPGEPGNIIFDYLHHPEGNYTCDEPEQERSAPPA